MELINITITEMSVFDPEATGKIYSIVVNISDIEQRVKEMNQIVADTSWLEPLDIIDQATYKARSKPTIDKIINDILNKVESDISEDFGEYMISESSQTALTEYLSHIRAPLAELIKEKISGNPGFDFHTESPDNFVVFGEAKYSGVKNSHGKALKQIIDFIADQKDIQELSDLRKFFTEISVQNAVSGGKSYCAAFSIISDDIMDIMNNAINSQYMANLLCYKAVYLIGVKISA